MTDYDWIDVSMRLKKGMLSWPGDKDYALHAQERISNGDEVNTSWFVCSTHTGTHIDAPWHFEPDGRRVHELPLELFAGSARLIDLPQAGLIEARDLGEAPLPRRVLLKTRNSERLEDEGFDEDYVAVGPDAAQRLVDEGVRIVGVDYLSVAPYGQPGQPTHHILLGNGVLIVEGLRLGGLSAGDYMFIVLPLALEGADGAPCRALAGRPRS